MNMARQNENHSSAELQLPLTDGTRSTTAGSETAAAMVEVRMRGEVLRIVYQNEDNGYTVLRLLDDKQQEQTLVGAMSGVLEGQDIEVTGRWETHKDHGRQLRVTNFHSLLPTSEKGIERYLASGLIPGIGPELARRIVARFGRQALDVLDKYSSRLAEVPGLGRKRIAQIRKSWQEHAAQRDTYIFLQGLGLSPGACARLFSRYGAGAGEVVRRNPYQLAGDIHGIGFITADRIAHELGIAADHPLRLAAGAVYAMTKLADDGHTCYPRAQLLQYAAQLLEVDVPAAESGLQRALQEGTLVADRAGADSTDDFIYPFPLYAAECELAESLSHLLNCHVIRQYNDIRFQGARWEMLNERQQEAVAAAFRSHISIITGGPGVGKTTVVGEIVATARRLGTRIYLAAPTGRAAKRLSESCNREARTVHRLLKWDPLDRSFVFNRDRPLKCDFLIVDEFSMMDVDLTRHLFAAVQPETHVVLVGDRDQLPSVGPGAVLHDLIACRRIPCTHLTEIYRQEEGSRIVTNAHAVNRGEIPDLRQPPRDAKGDFYWIDQQEPERVAELIARMVAERIPHSFGFNPMSDVQVLSPMNRGQCGAIALNTLLQETLNPGPKPQFTIGERIYRLHDRVMQTVNNYDKGVFNGELGQVVAIDKNVKKLKIMFDLGVVEYDWNEADQVKLAYAVTVHKSQGSEFPVVVMPLLTQHYVMLQRNLAYTGMTRARRLLVMIGSRKALAIAVRNDRPLMRYTRLADRLASAPRQPQPE
jgi:exodeoxyribonuclease V alpha subunit